ncbi:MAG: porin [Nitrospinae bacterium]|nr:porin [Nitrospinota bacterium]
MKKLLAIMFSIGFMAVAAHAEDAPFTIYGVLDAGVGYETRSLNADPNLMGTINPNANSAIKSANSTDILAMFNGGISGSRLGVKGSEALEGGWKFVFQLETGFNLPNGQISDNEQSLVNNNPNNGANQNIGSANANSSLAGQLFNRQAWIGMSSDSFGTLSFGRSYNFIFDVLSKYDPVQYAQMFSTVSFAGTFGGGAGVSEDTRVDDNIKYVTKLGDMNLGMAYKVGNMAGSTAYNQGWQFNLGYEAGDLGVQALYEQHNDAIKTGNGTTASVASGASLTGTAYNTRDWLVAVKYKVNDDAKVSVGYQYYTLSTPTDYFGTGPTKTWVTSLFNRQALITPYSTASTGGGNDQNIGVFFLGGSYNVGEKTNLAVGYYAIDFFGYTNGATDTTAAKQTATSEGFQTYYSLLLDHNYSKNTDAYLGIMFVNLSGGLYTNGGNSASGGSGYTNLDDATYGVGLRHKF